MEGIARLWGVLMGESKRSHGNQEGPGTVTELRENRPQVP